MICCVFHGISLISDTNYYRRYAIDTARADWQDAELQVARNVGLKGKSDVISIKSAQGVKRKAEDESVPNGLPSARPDKKTRRGKKAKRPHM